MIGVTFVADLALYLLDSVLVWFRLFSEGPQLLVWGC